MARNDGIDRTLARNQDLETPDDVTKVQEHNEREKDRYSNVDIVPERTALNVHFKSPTDDYVKMFEQMEQDKIISKKIGFIRSAASRVTSRLTATIPPKIDTLSAS